MWSWSPLPCSVAACRSSARSSAQRWRTWSSGARELCCRWWASIGRFPPEPPMSGCCRRVAVARSPARNPRPRAGCSSPRSIPLRGSPLPGRATTSSRSRYPSCRWPVIRCPLPMQVAGRLSPLPGGRRGFGNVCLHARRPFTAPARHRRPIAPPIGNVQRWRQPMSRLSRSVRAMPWRRPSSRSVGCVPCRIRGSTRSNRHRRAPTPRRAHDPG